MKFRSKKDENIFATLESQSDKYGTVTMEYVTGPNNGKTFSITTSTLKRWWIEVEEERSPLDILKINNEVVNTTYPEPKVQKYIPKPQSVIEYEAKKTNCYNKDLDSFDAMVAKIQSHCKKINETSNYVMLNDKTTIWRKQAKIDIYASETTWTKLTEKGLISSVNKDKDRPFAFVIKSREEYEKVLEVIING